MEYNRAKRRLGKMVYGYARVSAKEQNPERQYQSLEEEGLKRSDIYLDRMSGKDFSRPAYQEMLAQLKKGICCW